MGWQNIGCIPLALLLVACSSKDKHAEKRAQSGACTMRNALAKPKDGVPPGLEMCFVMQVEADCNGQSANLRAQTPGITTTSHVFHENKSCEQVGFTPCDGSTLPFTYHKPCNADGGSVAKSGGFASPEPGAGGPAYIKLRSGLAVILPDGTAQTVSDLGKGAWLRSMALGADGNVYVTTGRDRGVQFFRLDGASATPLGTAKGFTLSTALAVAKDGTIYFAQNDEVARFDGKLAKKLPPTGMSIVNQLAFDADGALVAAYSGQLRRFVNDAWQAVDVPGARSYTGVWIVGSGEDLVIGVQDKGFFKLVGGKLERTLGDASPGSKRPVRTANGVIAYPSVERGNERTRLHDPKGGTTASERVAKHIAATVVDARGRLWYVHDAALTVASLASKDATEYPIGTLPALADVTYSSGDGELLVVGAGPETLPPVGAVQTVGKVTGTITVGKGPLVGADIEICTFASYSYRTTPCDSAPKSRKPGKTDENGNFVLENVPVGNYQLAFKYGRKWGLAGTTFIDLTVAAAEKKLGKLRYEAPR